ncbi:MAG: FAD-binding oxidoreductase [Bacillus sp. (in: Bacteria)]|nr:FAD-binding oxidoreductase [Bacillus sp. (in: firmicutes)]
MKDYAEKSFWLETVGEYEEREALGSDLTCDVCIVGGGFTGLSTAIHLKEKDPSLRVVVLESQVVGYGASGRNAGFSMRLFGVTMELTNLRYGKERLKEADQYMVDAVDHLEKMIDRYDIDCDYVRDGMITVATNRQQLKHLEKEMKMAEELGLEGLKWLDEEETRRLVNSPTYLGARYDETCALLQPAKLARGLAVAAEKLGVEIYERTPVIDVRVGEKEVVTSVGTVSSKKIVLATNAYSSFQKKLKRKQIPLFTYISLTEPLTEEQLSEIGWGQRVGVEDARNLLHYYRLTPDNRLLLGGNDVRYYFGGGLEAGDASSGHDVDRNEEIRDRLQQQIKDTFPGLADVKFTHHWGGPISASLDLVPVIGELGPDVLYSMGCIGHGVSLTNYNGLTLAELLMGEESKRTDFYIINRRTTYIPPEPLRYVTVNGIRKYLKWEDNRGVKKKKS